MVDLGLDQMRPTDDEVARIERLPRHWYELLPETDSLESLNRDVKVVQLAIRRRARKLKVVWDRERERFVR